MKIGDDEAAYDYKNTILLENTDQYFDSYKMTFDKYGNPILVMRFLMII